MTLEIRGKYLFFEHEKGKYEFVRLKSIISCWDERIDSRLKYATEGNYFNVGVFGHTSKEVLEKLTGKKGSE